MSRRAEIAALVLGIVLGAIFLLVFTSEKKENTVTKIVPSKAPQGDLNSPIAPKDDSAAGRIDDHAVRMANNNTAGLVKKRPAAGAQTYSCTQDFRGHLWGTRTTPIKEWVNHYTAGPGTAESIAAYFRRTRAASATYILEPNGHCIQEVPESGKPWTQLAANSTSLSVEIVTTGYNLSRAQWLAMPIFKQGILAALMRDSMRRHGIPLHHVNPAVCNFTPGWTDHNDLECGNNHTDVQPNFPYDVLQRQLVDSGAVPQLPSARAVAQCKQLNRYRRRGVKNARRTKLLRNLKRHGYHCGRHGNRTVITRT